MIQGLYAAANGMMAVEDRQAVIANNIANATTPGFKRQIPVQKGFPIEYFGAVRNLQRFDIEVAPGGGAKATETFTNYTNGIVRPTGNALDVALLGPGFLRVQTPAGERVTRNGRFAVSSDGLLTTIEGHLVLGSDGNSIDVSGGAVRFDGDGEVFVNNESRGVLAVVEFEDPHALVREGYTLYRFEDATMTEAATATTVVGGSLEMSNVQIPNEIVQMMLALRAYAANQRVINAVDESASLMIGRVGSPS